MHNLPNKDHNEEEDDKIVVSVAEIESALTLLVGLQWRAIGRASHLLWMAFGEMREVPAWGGGSKSVGQWALHTDEPWQILAEGKVMLASSDYDIDSKGNPVADLPDRLARSRFDDVATRICNEFNKNAPTVVSAKGNESLGFSLNFSDGTRFDVVPNDNGELWRLFQPSTGKPHFVVER